MKEIGRDINDDDEQLKYVGGYDHNYVIDRIGDGMELAAVAKCRESGISMEVYTDCIGVQFYAGNFIGDQIGKGGAVYGDRLVFVWRRSTFQMPSMKRILHRRFCVQVKSMRRTQSIALWWRNRRNLRRWLPIS